jgi:hypothetical protein
MSSRLTLHCNDPSDPPIRNPIEDTMNRLLIPTRRLTPALAVAALLGSLAWLPARTGEEPGSVPKPAGLHQSKLVHPGPDGKLVYVPDAKGNVIPDFSHCGYEGGQTPPNVPVREIVAAPAKGESDSTARIQAAIDKVSAMPASKVDGLRGAVLIKKGTYLVHGTLRVHTSGVVVRGEGDGPSGTVLVAKINKSDPKYPLILIAGKGKWQEVQNTRRTITDGYVAVGAKSFDLVNTKGLSAGETIIVVRPSTQSWIHDLGMDAIPPRPDGLPVVQWQPGKFDLLFDRVITKITGKRITLNAPLTDAIEKKYGGGYIYRYTFSERIRRVGVEDLRGVSEFDPKIKDKAGNPVDENHSWNCVQADAVADGWVRKVTAIHFALSAVQVDRYACSLSVLDCKCFEPVSKIEGGRRYAFHLNGGQLALFQNCHSENGRHDFVTGSLTPGPSVFHDCTASKSHDVAGPHQRWAVGILYDNVRVPDTSLEVKNRGNLGSGQGWAGANHILWNCQARSIVCERPPTAQNYAIGCTSATHTGNGFFESTNQPVMPRSLYRAQLVD